MKTYFNCYTDPEVIARLRNVAHDVNAPIGDLLGLLLTYGLDRVKPDALRAWSEARVEKRGRPLVGALRKVERLALDGLREMTREGQAKEGVIGFRFCVDEVAHKVGLRIAVAQDALAALQMRGLVGSQAMSGDGPEPDYDAWGRAKGTVWWTVEAHAAWKLAKGIKG